MKKISVEFRKALKSSLNVFGSYTTHNSKLIKKQIEYA